MLGMTWSDVGTRFFETGIDRGVLFPQDRDPVPWNGLISVNKKNSGGEPQSYYLDGVKFLMDHNQEEYAATLEAFTYPQEFNECLGTQVIDGLEIHEQPRRPFGLCYRTLVGNDVEGENHGYKLNFVYNAMVGTTQSTHSSVGEEVDPTIMSWSISSVPEIYTGSIRASSYTVDSRNVGELGMLALETYIYGGFGGVGQLPTPSQIRTILLGAQAGYTYHWLGTPNNSQSVQRLGSVEIGRNYFVDPLLTQSAFRSFTKTSGEYNTTLVTGATDGPTELISTYARTDVISRATTGSGGYNTSTPASLRTPLSGGVNDPVSVSGYFRYTGNAPSVSYTLRVYFFNSSATVNYINKSYTFPNGEWVKIDNELVYPEGSYTHVAYWIYYIGGDTAPAGSTLDLAGIQIEKGYMSDLIVGSFPPVT